MVNLKTMESVEEQLALGNKLTSLNRRLVIDLSTQSKEEIVEASVDKLMMSNLDKEPPYSEEAKIWLEEFLPDFTTIVVRGKNGQVARVPYKQKDTTLPKIIQIFNS